MNKKKAILFFSLILGALFVYLFVLESQKITSSKITSWEEDHFSDCAVVLTGGSGRVREGFDMLTQKRIKKLIISGVYPKSSLRQIFPQWPFYGALKKNSIILEKGSRTTFGNAQKSLAIVEALHCRDITLITSQVHMYRAQKIFHSVFPKGFPIYTRVIVSGSINPDFSTLWVEVVKSMFYSLWAY